MAIPTIPDQIDNNPILVKEVTIRQFDCPNPSCDASIDITNVNVGTKIKCKDCNNVTWLPDYGNKWWQKPLSIVGGIILSFTIGVGSSIIANHYTKDTNELPDTEVIIDESSNGG
jgi:hypothetical protein